MRLFTDDTGPLGQANELKLPFLRSACSLPLPDGGGGSSGRHSNHRCSHIGLALLKADLRGVRALGFTGKVAIHPKQLAEINRFFTRSFEKISTAKHILEENSKGVGTVDGKMVDEAIARHARQVVAIAQPLGIQF